MNTGRKLSQQSLQIMRKIFEVGKENWWQLKDTSEDLDFIFDRRKFYQRMYNLQRQGYVKQQVRVKEKQNQSFFHLTPLGRLEILKYLHLEKLKKKKWDGRWRLFIFDVPESSYKWRNNIRAKLKALGFVALQESVYITPYPVVAEVDKFLKEWHLRKYVRYLTVSEIDNDSDLREKFGLK